MNTLPDGTMEVDANLNMSKLDDHDIAKLDKRLKRGALRIKKIDGRQPDIKDRQRLEQHLKREMNERRISPKKIVVGKVEADEWRDIFDMPDLLRHPNPEENSGATIDYPLTPAEYFRHARISLRQKLMKSKEDRKEVLDAFLAGAVSDNMILLQGMRLWMDKIRLSSPTSSFQDNFITNFGTVNSIKERKEKHVAALFETMSRIENLPISRGQVGQLNMAGNQQVNNGRQESPDGNRRKRHVS